jgi:hypothetical protein
MEIQDCLDVFHASKVKSHSAVPPESRGITDNGLKKGVQPDEDSHGRRRVTWSTPPDRRAKVSGAGVAES